MNGNTFPVVAYPTTEVQPIHPALLRNDHVGWDVKPYFLYVINFECHLTRRRGGRAVTLWWHMSGSASRRWPRSRSESPGAAACPPPVDPTRQDT